MTEISRRTALQLAARPVSIHSEHHGLLGTDLGAWKLDMRRREFLEIIKHDLDSVRAHTTRDPIGWNPWNCAAPQRHGLMFLY